MEKDHDVLGIKDIYLLLNQSNADSHELCWTRLQNYLLTNSFLIVAWATLYQSDKQPFGGGYLVMGLIVLLGFAGGFLWAYLGWRQSKIGEMLHDGILKIENSASYWHEVPNDLKPSRQWRKKKETEGWASEININTLFWVPIAFSVFYFVLIGVTYWSYFGWSYDFTIPLVLPFLVLVFLPFYLCRDRSSK